MEEPHPGTSHNVDFVTVQTEPIRGNLNETKTAEKKPPDSILQYFREEIKLNLPQDDVPLYNYVCSLKKHVSLARERKESGTMRLQRTEQLMEKDMSRTLKKYPRMIRQFICNRLTNVTRIQFRRNFTTDDKILALLLWHKDAWTYKFLAKIFLLPSIDRLHVFARRVDMKSEISSSIIEELKLLWVNLSEEEHVCCTLAFRQNTLTKIVNGLTDGGRTRRCKTRNYAGVWMLRSISKSTVWKRPIAYTFNRSPCRSEEIKSTFLKIVRRISETGFEIVSFVCDDASPSVRAIRALIEDSKRENKQSDTENIIIVDGCVIIPLIDPPHLLRSFRNHLVTKDLNFQLNDGQHRVANWSHILDAVFIGNSFDTPKPFFAITSDHLKPSRKAVMDHCCRIFSRQFGGTIAAMSRCKMLSRCGTRGMPEGALGTACLLMFLNDVYDSVSGGSMDCSKNTLRSSVPTGHMQCAQERIWDSAITAFRSMSFIQTTSGKQQRPAVLTNWIFTLQNFKLLRHHLRVCKVHKFYPCFLNQGPIEKFFYKLMERRAKNSSRDCRIFTDSYKMLICSNIFDSAVEFSNRRYSENFSVATELYSHREFGTSFEKVKTYFIRHMKIVLT